MSRKRTPDQTEAEVLIASRRRCALCYGVVGDLNQKRGQIAHVDRDPSNADFDNLAFLCLPHHDEYDSKTSQSKRFTPAELITYRKKLYDRVSQGLDARASPPSEAVQPVPSAATVAHVEAAPFFTLVSGSFSAGVMDFHVRNDGQPVTVLTFETTTQGAHIRQWYPTSLPAGELLRATVDLDHPEPAMCVFQIHLRDRTGLKRSFELRLDRASSPQRFDFFEDETLAPDELLPEYERIVLSYIGEHRVAEEERLTNYLEHLGFPRIAYTIAVEALKRKHLIELSPSLDPIPAHILYHLTDAGMRWLLEHPEQFIVRKSVD